MWYIIKDTKKYKNLVYFDISLMEISSFYNIKLLELKGDR